MIATETITGENIVAYTELITPVLKAPTIEFVGSDFLRVISSVPFGEDSLIEWYGKKAEAGSPIDVHKLNKRNCLLSFSDTGAAAFKGELGDSINSTGISTTLLTNYEPPVSAVLSGSLPPGVGRLMVVSSCNLRAERWSSTPYTGTLEPFIEVDLYVQVVGEILKTRFNSAGFRGIVTSTFDPERNQYRIVEDIDASSTGDLSTIDPSKEYLFTLDVISYNRVLTVAETQTQTISLTIGRDIG
jgi:hypothetical protein